MFTRARLERCSETTGATKSWCPWCYENRKQRANHKGHRYYVSRPLRVVTYQEYQLKRPSQASRPKKGEFVCPDSGFQSTYPLLAAGMCDPWWDDGKPRKPWTLKISMNDECVLLCLSDPDSKLVAFTTATELIEGLASIEKALEGEGVSWRKSKW